MAAHSRLAACITCLEIQNAAEKRAIIETTVNSNTVYTKL
jgi:hypothetical protein